MDKSAPRPAATASDGRLTCLLHGTAWWIVLTATCAMLFPVVLLRGMSLDGITYATLARNLAVGLGDAWHPYYTDTLNPFYEQPPVALVMESWLFRLLGDQWWVERLYSVLTALPTLGLLVLLWREMTTCHAQFRRFAWLAVALWILMPGWFWIYRHNYLENTLVMFTTLAVYAVLRAQSAGPAWPAWTLVAATATVAAVGSKGPVGLFPLAAPAIAWITLRGCRAPRAAAVQLLLIVLVVGGIATVLAVPDAREFAQAYWRQQVVDSLRGVRETVDSGWGRYYLLPGLAADLWPTGLAAAALVWWSRRAASEPAAANAAPAALFACLVALSASLPIMISPKQASYYAAGSWPFFALALAAWCVPGVEALAQRAMASAGFAAAAARLRRAAWFTAGTVVVSTPLWYGAHFRDRTLLADVELLARLVPPHGRLVIGPEARQEWSLQAYLYRYHFISLSLDDISAPYRVELAELRHIPQPNDVACSMKLTHYRVYRRAEPPGGASDARAQTGDGRLPR